MDGIEKIRWQKETDEYLDNKFRTVLSYLRMAYDESDFDKIIAGCVTITKDFVEKERIDRIKKLAQAVRRDSLPKWKWNMWSWKCFRFYHHLTNINFCFDWDYSEKSKLLNIGILWWSVEIITQPRSK